MNLTKEEIVNVLQSDCSYKDKYFQIYGESVSRDKARHRINNLQNTLLLQTELNESLGKIHASTEKICAALRHPSKININSDGTQSSEKLIDCSEEELKDSAFLLKMHGYDPEKFELVSAGSSMWQNGSNQGNKTLYASKIRVRPISKEKDLIRMIDEVCEKYTNEQNKGLLDTVDFTPQTLYSADEMLEICVPDLHIGLSEWEQGENSMSTQNIIVYEKIGKMQSAIATTGVSEVMLCFLGDIFHYDTINKTTSKGTQQCSNVPFQDAFDAAVRSVLLMIRSVAEALKRIHTYYTVNVLYVPGNHDTLLGYAIMAVAEAAFHNDENIKFDIRQQHRKFVVFGKNLIGYAHGDIDKKKLSQWLYTEAREYISNVKEIEVHCGHLHSEQVTEDNGVIVRHLPTICGVSPWEYQKGYHSTRRLTSFVWHRDLGLQEIKYL